MSGSDLKNVKSDDNRVNMIIIMIIISSYLPNNYYEPSISVNVIH